MQSLGSDPPRTPYFPLCRVVVSSCVWSRAANLCFRRASCCTGSAKTRPMTPCSGARSCWSHSSGRWVDRMKQTHREGGDARRTWRGFKSPSTHLISELSFPFFILVSHAPLPLILVSHMPPQVSVMVASSSNSSSGGSGPTSMHEPLVYVNGCLKNISNDTSNQRGLVKLGALQVLASLLTLMASQVRISRARTGSEAFRPRGF